MRLSNRSPQEDERSGDPRRSARLTQVRAPNRWLTDSVTELSVETAEEVLLPDPPPAARVRTGQLGIQVGPTEVLPRRELIAAPGLSLWWVGAHGGAGESTLTQLLDGSTAAGHKWPVRSRDDQADGPLAVLVARTSAHGLLRAQAALREWAAGVVPTQLLGLVLVADAPGRLPRSLRDLARLVASGAPRAWDVPWVDAWRLGEPPQQETSPRAVRGLLDDLRGLLAAHPNQEEE